MKKKKDSNALPEYGKTKIPITAEIFQMVRDLLLSDNNNVHLKDVIEIKRFFSIIDFEQYKNVIENIPASDYLKFLDLLVDASMDNNSISRKILIQNLLNESKEKEKFKIIYENRKEISNEDLFHLKKFMSDHVGAAYIFNGVDKLADIVTKIKSGDYLSVDEITDLYKSFITDSYRDINKFKVKEADERLDSGLDIDSLTNLASETIKEISTPGFYLNTGFLNLDNAMGGGLKRGALTLFGAKTAGFKSGMMLNIACSIKLFSKHIETFDKTKKPCVIYLSLENTQTESFKRLVTYTLNKNPSDLIGYDSRKLAKETLDALNVSTANPDLDLKLLYKKSNSIDINDIYNIITDVESDGYEVVSLIVDYLATMKNNRIQVKDQNSIGLAMADNARELYDLAISKNIAVVSGFQLNRGAYENNKNVTGKETVKYVGESLKMVTYADYVFMINKETLVHPSTGDIIDYIKFDEAKQRSNMGSVKGYFYEIFKPGNNFRLEHSKFYKKENGQSIDFNVFDRIVLTAKQIEKDKQKSDNSHINRASSTSIYKSEDTDEIKSVDLDSFINNGIDTIF